MLLYRHRCQSQLLVEEIVIVIRQSHSVGSVEGMKLHRRLYPLSREICPRGLDRRRRQMWESGIFRTAGKPLLPVINLLNACSLSFLPHVPADPRISIKTARRLQWLWPLLLSVQNADLECKLLACVWSEHLHVPACALRAASTCNWPAQTQRKWVTRAFSIE